MQQACGNSTKEVRDLMKFHHAQSIAARMKPIRDDGGGTASYHPALGRQGLHEGVVPSSHPPLILEGFPSLPVTSDT
jgi:hypothetical protein